MNSTSATDVSARTLQVLVLGKGNRIDATLKIREMGALDACLEQALAINPAVTFEHVLRAVLVGGIRELQTALGQQQLPSTMGLRSLG